MANLFFPQEKAAAWQQALTALWEMGRHGRRVLPNVVTFNAAISACEKAAKWQARPKRHGLMMVDLRENLR